MTTATPPASITDPGLLTAQRGRAALAAVVLYVVAMPFLAGLPRGTGLPLLRPSEGLQLAVTGLAGLLALSGLISGRRWQVRIRSIEWWLLAMVVSASLLPVLWLLARSQPLGSDELMAVFPFIKYASLYVLIRLSVDSPRSVGLVVKAMIGAATAIAAVSVAQAMGVGPVLDVLANNFVSSSEDVIDGGRGTTTIGSSIATGAYLSIMCGLSLSWGLATGNRVALAAAGALAVGTLGSGQAGAVIGLGVVILVVAHRHGQLARLISWSLPLGALAMVGLWPIVAARLAVVDQGTGLPQSWLIRWNNVSELYLPSLLDGGWILGVNPNAILQPPDVWRDAVYLESGYLWLLWVGGLPLLVAAVGFLLNAWRTLQLDDGAAAADRAAADGEEAQLRRGPMAAVAIAGQAAVAMFLVLSLLDPHLTLRAGADAFFVLLALAMADRPLVSAGEVLPVRWRSLLAADVPMQGLGGVRLQFREQTTIDGAEATMAIAAVDDGAAIASAVVALYREEGELRGQVLQPTTVDDSRARALVWRAVALMGGTLRLQRLDWTDPVHGGQATAQRPELKLSADLAEDLEIERVAIGHRFSRSDSPADRSKATAGQALPGIRLEPGRTVPSWKRAADLVFGGLGLIATTPLWLLTALAVRRSSPGPILYRQVRIGTGGLPFQIYKFRTMYLDNDDSAHRLQNKLELRGEAGAAKESDDPRITPVGRTLRRLSLDELPQLINVLRSEMSLVGPRPSLLWESELFEPSTRRRLTTRPGLTGLWQISGRADVSMSEMLELDLDYVDQLGPMIDLRCLVGTVTSVAAGEGAR